MRSDDIAKKENLYNHMQPRPSRQHEGGNKNYEVTTVQRKTCAGTVMRHVINGLVYMTTAFPTADACIHHFI